MKTWMCIVLACVTVGSTGQFITKRHVAPLVLSLVSGMSDGTAESLKFKYDRVDAKMDLNDAFWNPAVSWRNKYKMGDPAMGERFTGSSTVFVWTTDGYHLTRAVRNVTMATAITINVGHRQPWWQYVLDAVMYYLTYCIGFNLTYQLLWK